MKNKILPLSILAAFVVLSFSLQGQSLAKKYMLFEHFTQASCGPCASQNPAFNSLRQQNLDVVHHIAYHTSWPGVDPMYSINSSENGAMTGFYGVNAVPRIFGDGQVIGSPVDVTQQMIDDVTSGWSPIRIKVRVTDAGGDDRNVTVTVFTHGVVFGSNMRLKTAVVEKDIIYASAPGSNGETEFPNVFRDMLPHVGGSSYEPAAMGDSVVFELDFTMKPEYVQEEIYVLAYVIDVPTKEVINSGSSLDPDPVMNGIEDASQNLTNSLGQNFPNPADASTTIMFNELSTDAILQVVDVTGKIVVSQEVSQGANYATLETTTLSEGIYNYYLVSGQSISTAKRLMVAR